MRAWLGDTSLPDFVQTNLGRTPAARASAAAAAVPLFGWDTLDRLLRGNARASALVVARGRLVDAPIPGSRIALDGLLESGAGLVLRHAERHDEQLAELARTFGADLGAARVHVQLFVTPGGTYGFGWHYDEEHVFIAQTAGVKVYYLRANTVTPAGDQRSDFTPFREETSPLASARLDPGDWLYVPLRWWHFAKCLETSLSISIGVRI
jgi:hypothetical protein